MWCLIEWGVGWELCLVEVLCFVWISGFQWLFVCIWCDVGVAGDDMVRRFEGVIRSRCVDGVGISVGWVGC